MARALTALTIGPLEPRGDDGVLADVKTFSALGLHGAAVVTAFRSMPREARDIATEIRGLLGSVQVDAIKLTCPDDAVTLGAIAEVLAGHDVQTLVLDPAGAAFDAGTIAVLKQQLFPRTLVAVPNAAEAAALTGLPVASWEDMRDAARAIAAMGPANVVIKGAKRDGGLVTDLLFDGTDYRDYTAKRVLLAEVSGAGSTFAAAAAAALAKGETVQHSVAAAKAYVTKALQSTYDLGGRPAMHHYYRYWQPTGPGP
jgi:hydroxymethylpyrimidine/phosphomethylpyrimidine kinase